MSKKVPQRKETFGYEVGMGGWFEEVERDMRKREIFLADSWEAIAKEFFAYFYKGDAFSAELDALRQSYIKLFEVDDEEAETEIPKDERDFYNFVCMEVFNFIRFPKDTLLELYKKASSDLRQTFEYIRQCDDEIKKIESKKPDGGDNLKEYFQYIKIQNQDAQTEIMEFIVDEIKKVAVYKSKQFITVSSIFDYNYSFENRFRQKYYQPFPLPGIRNKFIFMGIGRISRLEKVFNDHRDQFYLELPEIIKKMISPIKYQNQLNQTIGYMNEKGF